ncbi:hypothetical protein BDN72DRAFT_848813 [Pluteus cervinus]|uniref:Uncharacterized protein n=2 Tax=Pluteus cervinus TaxID=181527 RepID=A0ACD3AA14_9AGAR|nr:hypothetical protein BDN72DRAFT_848871 [Pluteus cervinus]TFK62312.1 hypothetical protein BDN72DRAFT_848813 [Pluteus cervinus]
MAVSFRAFRRFLSGLIALISLTSTVLSFYIINDVAHKPTAIVLGVIEAATLIRASMPIWYRPVFQTHQIVASEAIAFFLLLPFHLILSLIVIVTELKKESRMHEVLLVLKVFIFTNTFIHVVYTFCFIVVVLLTVCAFDKDVWYRDIDSRPSPFPMTVLLLFVFPCLRPRQERPVSRESSSHNSFCPPGCNCAEKPTLTDPTSDYASDHAPQLSEIFRFGSNSSLSRSLVRIPDDMERRSSVVIAFEV